MVRLGNQVWYVLLTYATHRPNWFWFGGFALWLGFGLLMGTSGEASVEDREDGRMPWITLLFSSLWLANVMTVQTTQQFMHYRARLMPRFALAHSLVPLAIAMVAGLGVPAIFAYAQNTSLLPMAAFSSALFAAVFASVSTTTFSWLLFLAIIGPMFFGYSLWDIHVNLSPSISVAVLAGAWLGIAYSLVRLATIGEEDRSYERLIGWSGRSHTKPTRSTDLYDQPSSFGVWQSSSVRWQIADYWHDRIGSFHEGRPIRIIRLLRHGYGATPPELHALGTPIFLLAISLLLTFVEESEDVMDPLATIRLLPILAAVFFPAALAIDRLPQRRPFLPAEIMLPLSRETLIDSLLGAAAWNLALVWLAMNGVVLYFLWTVPGLEPSFLRMGTYLFLSAAVTIAMFGVALGTVLWESLASRIAATMFSVGVGVTLMLMWWFMRDGTTDVPFWIAGLIVLAFGRAMIKDARRAWLDLELG